MNRRLPALALLILLVSGAEANPCSGWCSRFFAGVFGRQQPTPLAMQDEIDLAVVSQARAPNVARGIDTMEAWGIPEAEARRAFDIAYARHAQPNVGWDDSYVRWKETIERSRNDSYAYNVRRGDRPSIVMESLEDNGLFEISVRPGAPARYVESGRKFGVDRDNFIGFFARAFVYFGGRARVTSIAGSHDPGDDLQTLDRAQLLQLAARSDVGHLADDFYGFVPVVARPSADNRLVSLFALPPLSGADNLALHLRDAGPQLQIAGPGAQNTGTPVQGNTGGLDDDDDQDVTHNLVTSGHEEEERRDMMPDGNTPRSERNPLFDGGFAR